MLTKVAATGGARPSGQYFNSRPLEALFMENTIAVWTAIVHSDELKQAPTGCLCCLTASQRAPQTSELRHECVGLDCPELISFRLRRPVDVVSTQDFFRVSEYPCPRAAWLESESKLADRSSGKNQP